MRAKLTLKEDVPPRPQGSHIFSLTIPVPALRAQIAAPSPQDRRQRRSRCHVQTADAQPRLQHTVHSLHYVVPCCAEWRRTGACVNTTNNLISVPAIYHFERAGRSKTTGAIAMSLARTLKALKIRIAKTGLSTACRRLHVH